MNRIFTYNALFTKILSPLWVISLLTFSTSYAQTGKGTISGIVKDSLGLPVPSVSVNLNNTRYGCLTDANGHFQLLVPAGNYILQINHIGFHPGVIPAVVKEGENTIIPVITLLQNHLEMDEVVVHGNTKYNVRHPSSSLRIQTPLIEVPQNIQVITKEVIEDQQAFDMLEGVTRNVSGVQKVEHWDNYARINMRGSQIAAFRNGMNVQMPWGPLTEDMSMVDRIEFVKGPAGFMLANGEPSGFYNVVTKKPTGLDKGEVTFSLGSFETYRATADIDGKLSTNGKLLYRINLMGQLKGSHRDYEYNNRYTIVPVIKYLIDDKSAVTLEYTQQFSQMNVIGSNYSFSKRGYADLPINFTAAEPNLDPSRINDRSLLAIFEHNFNTRWKLTAQAAYFHYSQVGQSIWPRGIDATNDSLMQRGISVWDALGINKTGQLFLNGKVSAGGITHTILAGLDMSHKDYYADWNQGATLGDSTFNIYDPQYGTVSASGLPEWDRTKDVRERGVRYNSSYNAIYIQDELGLFENRLRLTLAGRYTHYKNINPYSGTTDDGKFTPRVGASYSLAKNTTAYFVYDQAFIGSPGFDWQGNSFDPITGNNLEGGLKKDWFGGRWNSVLSVYQITKNNVLTADLEHPHPTSGQFVFRKQAGQQQTRGVELDVKGQIVENLSVVINYAYTDARVTKDSDPEVINNQLPGASKHIQNTWLNYKLSDGVFSGLAFSLGYQYQAGRSSWYVFDNSESDLPDYFRLDGGLGYHRDKFSIHVLVNNLLNEYLYSGSYQTYNQTYFWQTEPKRNVRLTVGYKF